MRRCGPSILTIVVGVAHCLAAVGAAQVDAAKHRVKPPRPIGEPIAICDRCGAIDPRNLAGSAAGSFTAAWVVPSGSEFVSGEVNVRTLALDGSGDPERMLSQGFPAGVGAFGDGSFVVVWSDVKGLFGPPLVLRAQRHEATGTIRSAVELGRVFGAAIATWPAGSYLLFSEESTTPDPNQLYAQRVDVADRPGSVAMLAAFPYPEQILSGFSACTFPGAGGVIAWSSRPLVEPGTLPPSTIAAVRFDNTGARVGDAILVSAAKPTTTGRLAVSCRADRGFVVSWETMTGEDSANLVMRRFSAAGTALGQPVPVNQMAAVLGQEVVLVAEPRGRLLAVWMRLTGAVSEIRGREFSAALAPLGDEFVLQRARRGFTLGYPSATLAGPQRLVLVWNEGGQDLARVFALSDR